MAAKHSKKRTIRLRLLKQMTSVLIVLALLFPLAFHLTVEVRAADKDRVMVEIDFVRNLLFNKYDVDVYIDNDFVAKMAHGTDLKKEVRLDNTGTHTIVFYKSGDRSVTAKTAFLADSHYSFCCKITTERKKIRIEEVACTENYYAASNCQALKNVLDAKDKEGSVVRAFADDYSGAVITIDGHIAALVENADKTYNVLIRANDYGRSIKNGPDFHFEGLKQKDLKVFDVDMTAGANITLTARVKEFDEDTGLFILEPILSAMAIEKRKEPAKLKAIDFEAAETVKAVQTALNDEGFSCGTADGDLGPKTKAAIKDYRVKKKLPDGEKIDEVLLAYLEIKGAEKQTTEKQIVAAPKKTESEEVLPLPAENSSSAESPSTGIARKNSAEDSSEIIVYLSKTGDKYHRYSSCGNMKNGTPVTLDEAINLHREACKKCNPPKK